MVFQPYSSYHARSATASVDRRSAFTLVELLVVIAIVALLVAVLLPAVEAARRSAWRLKCAQNEHQIGIGLHAYHAAHGSFPPGGIEWRRAGDTAARQLAWSAFLLPFVEEQALYDRLDLTTAFDSSVNAEAAATLLPLYICPTSERGPQLVSGRGPCDYGGIFGERISSRNDPPKGTMLYDRTVKIRQITDGTSRTIIVAEDSKFADGQWINGRNIFDQAFAINQAPPWENDIRSQHGGGANTLYADGSVHFLTDFLDKYLLGALCTRAGQERTTR